MHSGEWKESSKLITDVALKFLNSDAKQGEKLKFLQEAATMAQFRHSNVVTFYGITEKDGSVSSSTCKNPFFRTYSEENKQTNFLKNFYTTMNLIFVFYRWRWLWNYCLMETFTSICYL